MDVNVQFKSKDKQPLSKDSHESSMAPSSDVGKLSDPSKKSLPKDVFDKSSAQDDWNKPLAWKEPSFKDSSSPKTPITDITATKEVSTKEKSPKTKEYFETTTTTHKTDFTFTTDAMKDTWNVLKSDVDKKISKPSKDLDIGYEKTPSTLKDDVEKEPEDSFTTKGSKKKSKKDKKDEKPESPRDLTIKEKSSEPEHDEPSKSSGGLFGKIKDAFSKDPVSSTKSPKDKTSSDPHTKDDDSDLDDEKSKSKKTSKKKDKDQIKSKEKDYSVKVSDNLPVTVPARPVISEFDSSLGKPSQKDDWSSKTITKESITSQKPSLDSTSSTTIVHTTKEIIRETFDSDKKPSSKEDTLKKIVTTTGIDDVKLKDPKMDVNVQFKSKDKQPLSKDTMKEKSFKTQDTILTTTTHKTDLTISTDAYKDTWNVYKSDVDKKISKPTRDSELNYEKTSPKVKDLNEEDIESKKKPRKNMKDQKPEFSRHTMTKEKSSEPEHDGSSKSSGGFMGRIKDAFSKDSPSSTKIPKDKSYNIETSEVSSDFSHKSSHKKEKMSSKESRLSPPRDDLSQSPAYKDSKISDHHTTASKFKSSPESKSTSFIGRLKDVFIKDKKYDKSKKNKSTKDESKSYPRNDWNKPLSWKKSSSPDTVTQKLEELIVEAQALPESEAKRIFEKFFQESEEFLPADLLSNLPTDISSDVKTAYQDSLRDLLTKDDFPEDVIKLQEKQNILIPAILSNLLNKLPSSLAHAVESAFKSQVRSFTTTETEWRRDIESLRKSSESLSPLGKSFSQKDKEDYDAARSRSLSSLQHLLLVGSLKSYSFPSQSFNSFHSLFDNDTSVKMDEKMRTREGNPETSELFKSVIEICEYQLNNNSLDMYSNPQKEMLRQSRNFILLSHFTQHYDEDSNLHKKSESILKESIEHVGKLHKSIEYMNNSVNSLSLEKQIKDLVADYESHVAKFTPLSSSSLENAISESYALDRKINYFTRTLIPECIRNEEQVERNLGAFVPKRQSFHLIKILPQYESKCRLLELLRLSEHYNSYENYMNICNQWLSNKKSKSRSEYSTYSLLFERAVKEFKEAFEIRISGGLEDENIKRNVFHKFQTKWSDLGRKLDRESPLLKISDALKQGVNLPENDLQKTLNEDEVLCELERQYVALHQVQNIRISIEEGRNSFKSEQFDSVGKILFTLQNKEFSLQNNIELLKRNYDKMSEFSKYLKRLSERLSEMERLAKGINSSSTKEDTIKEGHYYTQVLLEALNSERKNLEVFKEDSKGHYDNNFMKDYLTRLGKLEALVSSINSTLTSKQFIWKEYSIKLEKLKCLLTQWDFMRKLILAKRHSSYNSLLSNRIKAKDLYNEMLSHENLVEDMKKTQNQLRSLLQNSDSTPDKEIKYTLKAYHKLFLETLHLMTSLELSSVLWKNFNERTHSLKEWNQSSFDKISQTPHQNSRNKALTEVESQLSRQFQKLKECEELAIETCNAIKMESGAQIQLKSELDSITQHLNFLKDLTEESNVLTSQRLNEIHESILTIQKSSNFSDKELKNQISKMLTMKSELCFSAPNSKIEDILKLWKNVYDDLSLRFQSLSDKSFDKISAIVSFKASSPLPSDILCLKKLKLELEEYQNLLGTNSFNPSSYISLIDEAISEYDALSYDFSTWWLSKVAKDQISISQKYIELENISFILSSIENLKGKNNTEAQKILESHPQFDHHPYYKKINYEEFYEARTQACINILEEIDDFQTQNRKLSQVSSESQGDPKEEKREIIELMTQIRQSLFDSLGPSSIKNLTETLWVSISKNEIFSTVEEEREKASDLKAKLETRIRELNTYLDDEESSLMYYQDKLHQSPFHSSSYEVLETISGSELVEEELRFLKNMVSSSSVSFSSSQIKSLTQLENRNKKYQESLNSFKHIRSKAKYNFKTSDSLCSLLYWLEGMEGKCRLPIYFKDSSEASYNSTTKEHEKLEREINKKSSDFSALTSEEKMNAKNSISQNLLKDVEKRWKYLCYTANDRKAQINETWEKILEFKKNWELYNVEPTDETLGILCCLYQNLALNYQSNEECRTLYQSLVNSIGSQENMVRIREMTRLQGMDAKLTEIEHSSELTSETKAQILKKLQFEFLHDSNPLQEFSSTPSYSKYHELRSNISKRLHLEDETTRNKIKRLESSLSSSSLIMSQEFELNSSEKESLLAIKERHQKSVSKDKILLKLEETLKEHSNNCFELKTLLSASNKESSPKGIEASIQKLFSTVRKCRYSLELITINYEILKESGGGVGSESLFATRVGEAKETFSQLLTSARKQHLTYIELNSSSLIHGRDQSSNCPLCESKTLHQLEVDLLKLDTYLETSLTTLQNSKVIPDTIEELEDVIQEHHEFLLEMDSHKSLMMSINVIGNHFVAHYTNSNTKKSMKDRLKKVRGQWEQIVILATSRQTNLQTALLENEEFHRTIENLTNWLDSKTQSLRSSEPVNLNEDLETQYNSFKDLLDDLKRCEPRISSLQETANQLEVQLKDDLHCSEVKRKLSLLAQKLRILIDICKIYINRLSQALGREPLEHHDSDELLLPTLSDKLIRLSKDHPLSSVSDKESRNVLRRSYYFLGRVVRASVPIQVILLILLGVASIVPLSQDDLVCSLQNTFQRSLEPMVHWSNGPPPI